MISTVTFPGKRGAVPFWVQTKKWVQAGLLLLRVNVTSRLLYVELGITLFRLQSSRGFPSRMPFYSW